MANKFILIKPLITEKSEGLAGTQNNYCFQVDKRANKLEIKKAVQDMYSVAVVSVKILANSFAIISGFSVKYLG